MFYFSNSKITPAKYNTPHIDISHLSVEFGEIMDIRYPINKGLCARIDMMYAFLYHTSLGHNDILHA